MSVFPTTEKQKRVKEVLSDGTETELVSFPSRFFFFFFSFFSDRSLGGMQLDPKKAGFHETEDRHPLAPNGFASTFNYGNAEVPAPAGRRSIDAASNLDDSRSTRSTGSFGRLQPF